MCFSAAAVAAPRPAADEAKVLIRVTKKTFGSPNTETLDLKANGRSVTLYLMRGVGPRGALPPRGGALAAGVGREAGVGVNVQPPILTIVHDKKI